MPFASYETSQVLGIGNYVGEIRQGPDGQLYEWVEGVDGLGNDIGFWKGVKKLASKAVKFIPGIGPVIEQVRGAVKGFCQGLPKLAPCAEQSVELKPVFQIGTKLCSILGKAGLAGAEDGIMQAPDGQLYEVVEGIGESGQVKQYLRPVWMSIPVVIRPRRRHGARRGVQAQPGAVAPRPPAPAQAGAPVRRFR
jgi:hypothetical protein